MNRAIGHLAPFSDELFYPQSHGETPRLQQLQYRYRLALNPPPLNKSEFISLIDYTVITTRKMPVAKLMQKDRHEDPFFVFWRIVMGVVAEFNNPSYTRIYCNPPSSFMLRN